MTTWLDCGYKYELTKLHGLQDGHAVWLTGGTAVHLATEYYDKSGSLSMDLRIGFLLLSEVVETD